MTQTAFEKAISSIADHTGLCWLSLILWKDGIFGRSHNPVHKCKDCGYCGKHREAGQE